MIFTDVLSKYRSEMNNYREKLLLFIPSTTEDGIWSISSATLSNRVTFILDVIISSIMIMYL